MTIKELKKILIDEKINPNSYEIEGSDYLRGYDGFIILKGDNGKWMLYYMERGEKNVLSTHNNQHEVCIAFLEVMARGDKQLKKYIPQSEIA
ncbi:MAG: hypothetical protein RR089_05005 [Acidaminococcaceae bacterium]